MSLYDKASIYLCRYWGQRGTPKQIAKLQKLGPEAVFRMARQRGFNE